MRRFRPMGDQSDDSAVTRAKAPVVAACTAAMLVLAICAYVFTRGWTSFGCLVAVLVLYAAVAWRVVARNWTSRQRWDAMTMPDHVSRFAYYTVPPVVLLVLGSAAVYWQLGHQAGSACMSPPLDRASAVYFAATTFTTTGYGDI